MVAVDSAAEHGAASPGSHRQRGQGLTSWRATASARLFRVHHLGRKPRPGDRLRRRRLPAAAAADRGGHPALAGQAPARPVALHHPAARARQVKILSGVFEGADHRHADRADDRERRPALQGLRRHRGQVPARPCRLSPIRRIRHPRLSRRRPVLGARNRQPRRRRRHRAQGAGRSASRSAARWSRSARTGSTARAGTGTQIDAQSVLLPRRRRPRRLGRPIWTASASPAPRIGAVIEVVADGRARRLGAPIYGKLDSDLAAAMMSINAVKGVEIGDGFAAAELSGEDNADEMRHGPDGERVRFLSNHAGGILGGISTGQDVVVRFAVKPTSLDPDAAPDRRSSTATRPRSSPRDATTPASASAPCRWARP